MFRTVHLSTRLEVAHLELRARQAEREYGKGLAPSDEGLVGSQPILGALA